MAPRDGVTPPLQREFKEEQPVSPERLDSWKEIAAYLKRSVRTVRRWEAEEGLPVHRHVHQSAGSVYAFSKELDVWLISRRAQLGSTTASDRNLVEPDVRPASSGGRRRLWLAGVCAALAVLLTGDRLWPSAPIHSLAVLPLANLTGDPQQESFADGMTDALITALAQSGGPSVIARTSVIQLRDPKRSIPEIARELHVDGIVEAALVSRVGSRVTLTASLIHAPTQRILWAQSYERDPNDLVALQQDIARAITAVATGRASLPPSVKSPALRPVSEEAYAWYLKSYQVAGNENYEGFKDAVAYCQKAIDKQPDFAMAYARMALYYVQFSFVGPLAPTDFMPKAEAAARKAVALDDKLAEAHAILGNVLQRFDRDWSGSEMQFEKALTLSPSYADGHRMFSVLLSKRGRHLEAIQEATRARELDPLSLQAGLNLAQAYRAAGEVDRALLEFRNALDKDSNRPRTHFFLGETYVEMGRLSQGLSELETAVHLAPRNARFRTYLGYAYAVAGRNTEATAELADLLKLAGTQYVSPFEIGRIYAGLGDYHEAIVWLERADRERDPALTEPFADVGFTALQSDPQYRELLARLDSNR
jgi:TolB-like protein